ncbi:MAG: hypothetical protein AAGI13_11330 [Pseudomonadota bacterium]
MHLSKLAAMALIVPLLTGCVAVVAGTAGGLIVDEGIVENDGKFDPLENTDAARAVEDAVDAVEDAID